MSLTFILGKEQKDHKQKLIDIFLSDYQKNPQDKFYFIVPNHIKFESEIEIIESFKKTLDPNSNIIATNNLQIFSLSRMAWYYLRDTNELNAMTLTETKKAMIIKYIITQHQKDLKIFKGEINKEGFIDELSSQIDELLQGQIDIDDLTNIINNSDSNFEKQKIRELKIIYADYLDFINQNYLHENLLMEKLTNLFENSDVLDNSHFYFYGFSTFKNSEYNLLQSIILRSQLSISFNIDKVYTELPEKTDFYFRPARTYQTLYKFARLNNIDIHNEYATKNRISSDLQLLENFWIASNSTNTKIEDTNLDNKNSLQIWQCSDRHTEIQAIATYIRQLVATKNYRFKDFLILGRDLTKYDVFIKPVFDNAEVPIFFDLQNNMAQHPLKLLIDYLIEFHNSNLDHESIFQMLKLGLLRPDDIDTESFQDAINIAENYSLANNLFKNNWLSDEKFKSNLDEKNVQNSISTQFSKINIVKSFVKKIYLELDEIFNANTDNLTTCTNFYNFLTNNNVFIVLKEWQNFALDNSNVNNADRITQIVNTLNQILDEFIEIFGKEKFNAKSFLNILDSGFSKSQYSQIPSTLDAVNISELGMVQMNNRKITIILGATAEDMPASIKNNSLISDEEKILFSKYIKSGSSFSDVAEITNNDEPYLHNSAFTSGSTRLIFTYPTNSLDNQEQISNYLLRIKKHFDLSIRIITNNPENNDDNTLEYIGSKNSTLNYLIRLNRFLIDQREDLSPRWKYVQNIILESKNAYDKLDKSLNYQNIPRNLTPDNAKKLYGNRLNVSISQIETFYKNEYEYFLKYGLKLKTREVFELTPANIGNYFHESFDKFIRDLSNQKLSLDSLTSEQMNLMINNVTNELLSLPAYKVFSASPQMIFIKNELVDIIKEVISSVSQQSRYLRTHPVKTEVVFGNISGDKDIPGITYNLKNDYEVNVRGKIDRIDEFSNDGLLQILDYKSSNKKFEYKLFNSGLQLQLPTYIQAVKNSYSKLTSTKNPKIAGAFYYHVFNPTKNSDYISAYTNSISFDKEHQLTGIIIDDADKSLSALTSGGLDKKNSSNFYKLKINKNDLIKPTSSVNNGEIITEEELDILLATNKEKILSAAQRIFSGKLALNPFRLDNGQTGLQFTDYKSIFEFDAMLPENNYRDIKNINKGDFFKENTMEDKHGN